ncbi:MAG: fatty acid CoA ligase family protein [Planctomycetota bacterium]
MSLKDAEAGSLVDDGNIAARLGVIAGLVGGAIAIAEPSGPPSRDGSERSYSITTFSELDQRATKIARGLIQSGLQPGQRMAMLVPFGAEFITICFGLLRAGAVAVLIDPGMGRKHLIQCLADAKPNGFVGIPKAQAIRSILRSRFPDASLNVTVGRKWFWGGYTLAQIESLGSDSKVEIPSRQRIDPAAVIFTTGSTGPPKGVAYSHGTFHAQVDLIRERYDIHKGGRDLACFPLFGLFDAVMGVTTIIPDMDPTRPAEVNPRRLAEAAAQWECDQAFGSPALWNTVVRWAKQNRFEQPFPTLRRVLSAGAPVPAETLGALRQLLHEEAEIHTPYGATEALPIASIEARPVIAETGPAAAKGKGVCVGNRFDQVDWRVIEINDNPIEEIESAKELPRGKIGELMVTGPMVTKKYVVRADQNSAHKVRDGERIWHRMGDVGYLDSHNRFWFCGRKTHRVVGQKTWFTVPCESIINQHSRVYRSALIGLGEKPNQSPMIVVEPIKEHWPKTERDRQKLLEELLDLAKRNPITMKIDDIRLASRPLPVDIRHNSKIFREKIAADLDRYSEK